MKKLLILSLAAMAILGSCASSKQGPPKVDNTPNQNPKGSW